MTTIERPRYNVIGTRPIRPDGVEKVTGRAQYGADVRPPGLAFGRILRSPHAHARIRRIDTSAAERMPGVLAIVTAADLPPMPDEMRQMGEFPANLRDAGNQMLASEKVLYQGHAIAAVAATNAQAAEDALGAIVVDYEVLPPVLDVQDAMRDDSPILDERRRTKSMLGAVIGEKPTNVAMQFQFTGGDIEAAFAAADKVIEREFRTTMVHQGYIEPHNGTASWNADGSCTVWTSTQAPFIIRGQTAVVLGVSPSKVKVVTMEIGGGFGGKIFGYLEPVAALLSRKCGRPVKITMNRAEVLAASGPTSGAWMKVKMAVKGRKLTACEATLAFEAGAFQGSPVASAATCVLSPYEIEHFQIEGYDVVVNKPKVAAYRAPGAPIAAFAVEQLIDELAKAQGIDPLVFRLENSAREGTKRVTGQPLPRVGHEECVQAALDSPHYRSPIEGPNRGRGVASGFWGNAGLQSSAVVAVNVDGTVNLVEGNPDIGGSRASLAMQLAETLGIGYDCVKPNVADTDSIPQTDVTGGSRVTFATGKAVIEAGMAVREEMRQRAATLWKCNVADVVYDQGSLRSTADPKKSLSFAEVAAASNRTGGPISGKCSLNAMGAGPSYGTHIVDVEVDPATGKVDILRYTAVQDAGTAIHPSYVEGQIQGGAVQGIGWALNEEYYYDAAGRLANASFLDYRMPTALDLPMIETIVVEVPNPDHPFGVRGVGECGIVPPLAAIANAVAEATGHRFTELPLSPRRVVETLQGLG